ncbi:hypothetical protein OQX61_12530 [Pedobacter sp. PLR]|uniref:hypothetical protein n=1 Tax=Pedobacter sp. PLR TaxID=2994465 RepID=UPI002247DD5D|nr:hypothetical protein [Pedobacter sp. PLR]MCX2452090.1 hypothetical protein [Pedobacter sp. PLR]
MKTLILMLFVLTNIACNASTIVYTCNSGHAKRYHLKSNCRGLSKCHYKLVKTTLEKAKADEKTLCRWEVLKQKQQVPSKKKHKL